MPEPLQYHITKVIGNPSYVRNLITGEISVGIVVTTREAGNIVLTMSEEIAQRLIKGTEERGD